MTAKPGRGGARPGAGRKPKHADMPPTPDASIVTAADSVDLLRKVVTGEIAASLSLRVESARTLIRFESGPLRAPIPTPPAKELKKREATATQRTRDAEWQRKADAIVAEHQARAKERGK